MWGMKRGMQREREGRVFGWLVDRACALVWLGAVMGPVVLAPGDAAAQESLLSVEETEVLVRARYFEGMPMDEAARIGPDGCERLLEMLSDSTDSGAHGQVLVAIGACGPDGGLEAIDAWAAGLPEGEVYRATFRAWMALPRALSHLAEHDPRAMGRLGERLAAAEAPLISHKRHRGAKMLNLKRRGAATALAESGRDAARRHLDRALRRSSDGRFDAHLAEARSRHADRVAARRARRGEGAR